MPKLTITADILYVEPLSVLSYLSSPAGEGSIVIVPHANLDGVKIDTRTSYQLPYTFENKKLAKRLAKAFNEGAAFEGAAVLKDAAGESYASWKNLFLMKRLSLDLEAIGY